jgi:hypothetical protein
MLVDENPKFKLTWSRMRVQACSTWQFDLCGFELMTRPSDGYYRDLPNRLGDQLTVWLDKFVLLIWGESLKNNVGDGGISNTFSALPVFYFFFYSF